MCFTWSPTSAEAWFQQKALAYLDEFLDSSRNHSHVLNDIRSGLPLDTIHAVCLRRPCLLSASLSRPLSDHVSQVRVAKDLLPMVLISSEAVESLEHPLSHAVDAGPETYFESKQGSRPLDAVSSFGWHRSVILLRWTWPVELGRCLKVQKPR